MSKNLEEKLDEVCIPKLIFNNQKIEDAVERNVLLIDKSDLENIHFKILDILGISSEKDSKYFIFEKFRTFYVTTKLIKQPTSKIGITEFDLI